jgi:hypothetical protein
MEYIISIAPHIVIEFPIPFSFFAERFSDILFMPSSFDNLALVIRPIDFRDNQAVWFRVLGLLTVG